MQFTQRRFVRLLHFRPLWHCTELVHEATSQFDVAGVLS